jgi:bifunctional pyridoxal-dependent enzyme with beta-cystathionase and maltose regulon repressor activities
VTGRTLYECPLLFTENRYSIHFSLLEDLCRRQNVSLLVFCNPHNPVGRVWSRRELETVAEICLRNHVFVASDEIHWDLILPGGRFTSMAGLDRRYTDNCAVSTASTKTFNTAAFKGAVVIMTDASRRERFIKCGGVSGRDLFSFQACELAYRRCEAWLDELLCVLDSNRKLMRDFLRDRLPEIGVIPLEATYLQWLDFRFLGLDAQELEDFMAFRARCFFTEGRKFGSAGIGFERWSIACPQKVLLAGLERMEKAVRAFRRAD